MKISSWLARAELSTGSKFGISPFNPALPGKHNMTNNSIFINSGIEFSLEFFCECQLGVLNMYIIFLSGALFSCGLIILGRFNQHL